MAGFSGIQVIKGKGGLGRKAASEDAYFGIIVTAPVLPTGISAFGDVVKLAQPSDAVALGIDESYDANNGVLVYHHISEYFRLQPSGVLYLTILQDSETAITITEGTVSKLENFIKSESAERKIKFVGIVLNRQASYTPTYNNGIDDDIHQAIYNAQAVLDKLAGENIFIDGVMFGAIIDSNVSITNILDLRTMDSPGVSVVIAQDPKIKEVHGKDYAAVGTALGSLAVRMVQECLGSVDIRKKPDNKLGTENYTLTDNAQSLWLSANLSDGRSVNELSQTDKTNLDAKGYIFVASYEGYPGLYFNNSSTATAETDDFAFIENNRTWDKAARIVVKKLTPRINSDVDIDPDTGQIKSTTITAWQQVVKKAIGDMLADGEISGFDFYIDPEQNVLSGEPILTELSVVPKGIAREIKAIIGFTNPLT